MSLYKAKMSSLKDKHQAIAEALEMAAIEAETIEPKVEEPLKKVKKTRRNEAE